MKIAVDAMGGDNAPEAVVLGAVMAAKEQGINILLLGDENKINEILNTQDYPEDKIKVVHTTEIVTNEDKPTVVVKKKKDSSLIRCFDLVKSGQADALVSAGSTGALLMAGIHIFGRIKGVRRPALAAVLPNGGAGVLLIDTGANANCKTENLVQFAVMGNIYAQKVMNIQNPKVGLLSNGTEEGKGSLLVKSAYEPISNLSINFIGNCEARDVLAGKMDVLVCDGFAGNVLLKAVEGTGSIVFQSLKDIMKKSVFTKIGALLLKSGIMEFKKTFDYKEYGGAPFLGVSHCVLKAHGSADAKSICNTIKQANTFAESGAVQNISEQIKINAYFEKTNESEEEE